MMFFGKPKVDPIEEAKNWKRELTKESRKIERDIASIQREEQKALRECKKLVQSHHLDAAKILAKEVAQTRKAVERLYGARAQINSASMMLQNSIGIIKMQGCVQKSAEVMHVMNSLVKIPEVSQTVTALSREMAKMGFIDELVTDALEAIEPAGLEASADAEVEAVIAELTSSLLAGAAPAPTGQLPTRVAGAPSPTPTPLPTPASSSEAEAEADALLASMQSRLQAL